MWYATVQFDADNGIVVGTFTSRSTAYRHARQVRDEHGGKIVIVRL